MTRLADWATRPRGIEEWARLVVTALVLLACPLFVLGALHPSKVFLDTTPAGGDMGAHVWAPDYLRHHLFPHLRLSGWTPDWYNGFPALTFYFPGPYLVIALLSYVLPYGVAFKLVSVSGVVCLPLAAYGFGRLTGMRFPGPPLLAIAAVPFLFDRYFTIWGGNIASTLAGEFAFSISLCFALLFIGVFSKSLDTGRYRWLAALLFAATLLSHLLPTFLALAGAVIVWLLRPSRRRLGRAVLIGAVGLAITAFWLLPFAVRLGYSNDMGWERSTAFAKGLFPFLCSSTRTDPSINCPAYNVVHPYTAHLELVVGLAAAGALAGIVLRRRTTLVIVGLGVLFAGLFRFMPQGTLWNARMLPFWYLMLYFAAATCVAEAALALGVLFGRAPRGGGAGLGPAEADGADLTVVPVDGDGAAVPREALDLVPSQWPGIIAPVVVGLLVLAFVGQSLPDYGGVVHLLVRNVPIGGADQRRTENFVSGWANWNYSGYERKPAYPEYRDVVDTMARVGRQDGCGRSLWEYESEEDRFGTPMALMLLPMWTNGCIGSEEGLFFESSATVAYHFLNQSELSPAPSRAMRGLPYRDFNIVDGIRHLQLLGVRYYLAVSPSTQTAARTLTTGDHPALRLVASTRNHQVTYTRSGTTKAEDRHWEVYEVAESDPVAPLSYQPVVMTGVPTAGKGWVKLATDWYQDSSRWDVPLAASGPASWTRVKGADPNPPRTPVHPAVIANIRTTDDAISFDVDRPGSPVLVKTSYFPNWQAVGAHGPWRVTPNSMVVIPTSTHVELHYGFTPVDNAGRLLSAGGLVAAGLLWWREREASHPGGEDAGAQDAAAEGAAPEGAAAEGGAGEDGAGEDGAGEGGAGEDGAGEGGAGEDVAEVQAGPERLPGPANW